jgi:hypothetical protein
MRDYAAAGDLSQAMSQRLGEFVWPLLISLEAKLAKRMVQTLLPGKRYRDASIPLYRLRSALSRLGLSQPPHLKHFGEAQDDTEGSAQFVTNFR